MAAMSGAAIIRPSGMERRGFLISPAMKDADSGPVHANAMMDQNIKSLIWKPGRIVVRVTCVAGPAFHQTYAPSAISSIVTVQRLAPPILFSHLPTPRP